MDGIYSTGIGARRKYTELLDGKGKKMNVQYMTSSDLKTRAKNLLDGRYGPAVLILFVGNMLMMAPSMFASSFINKLQLTFQLTPVASQLITLLLGTTIGVFTTNIYSVGYALFFLNMACRRSCDVSQLFHGFRWQFDKCLTLSGFFAVISLVCNLPYQLCGSMFVQTKDTSWLMATLLLASAAMVGGTVISLMLSQCYYLLLDFPDYTARQLLHSSIQIMKGHKGRLFYLQMSFVPLTLLALLTCGIGMLWLSPYMQTTYACFFLDLMNPRKVPADAPQET